MSKDPQETQRYQPDRFEGRWQARWREMGLFRAGAAQGRPPFYMLEMFPYPSGKMHMGHVRVYAIGDVLARYMRMQGRDVLHPMGWDAFGLPAENAAIKEGVHPDERTRTNIESFKAEMVSLGFAYDWEREFATCDPDYYRWNQWFFLQLWKKGLVYRRTARLNWCPSCATVLANEQVEDGRCWRCGSAVEEREMPQWAIRITAYADELLQGLDTLSAWPERVVTMQRNWIGRSEGVEVDFPVKGSQRSLRIFTTRADTIYGATYMVLAPEHPAVAEITTADRRAEVDAFVEKVRRTDKFERTSPDSEKEGVFTGAFAENPFSGETIPIWVGNFVLAEYGTGAIMSVPAHDERDFRFARKYGLPIRVVVQPEGGERLDGETLAAAFTGDGVLDASGEHTGLSSAEARKALGAWVGERGIGEPVVNFHLRDWGISRQRYWGTPIPMVHCEEHGAVPVPEDQLPVELPRDVKFTGEGGSPLLQSQAFLNTTCPVCGRPAVREAETMDTFVDSSWYYARYLAPHDREAPFRPEQGERWLPVDVYVGGPEHAVMHLLYFRFWHRFMRDLGLVKSDEPVKRLVTQGIVMKGGAKMSKSLGNVVSPSDMIERFGADTVRMFMLFAAPPEKDIDWNDDAVEGQHRFLARVWRLVSGPLELLRDVPAAQGAEGLDARALEAWRQTHKTIQAVTRDIEERLSYNTAIARIMELVNHLQGWEPEDAAGRGVLRFAFETLVTLLHPFAPHATEELWSRLGHDRVIVEHAWPVHDPAAVVEDTVSVAVQVNGKLRGTIQVAVDADAETVKAAARAEPNVQRHLEGKTLRKEIVVPGRLVNFVVS